MKIKKSELMYTSIWHIIFIIIVLFGNCAEYESCVIACVKIGIAI